MPPTLLIALILLCTGNAFAILDLRICYVTLVRRHNSHISFKLVARVVTLDIDECVSTPCVHGTCIEPMPAMFGCTCENGWTGQICDTGQSMTNHK